MTLRLITLGLLLAWNSVTAAEPTRSHPSIGTKDGTGRLVLHVFGASTIVHLAADYGIVMCRRANGDPLFVIGDKAKNTVREFSGYSEFLAAPDDVPADSLLTIHDRCLMPRFHDFYPVHFELYKKFRRECGERGLKLSKEDKIVCTCPEGGG